MFMWLIRQLLNIRKVLDGRKHPHQLAWGLALGFFVGIVPHGNLLAFALIAMVLCLRVNHSLAALTGVTVALLLATKLDPLTHQIGQFVLTEPRWHDALMLAWEWPLMPWTDLNNTVVTGSLVLGVAMVLPLYAVSYPIFRYFQPAVEDETPAMEQLTMLAAQPSIAQTSETKTEDAIEPMHHPCEPVVEWCDEEISSEEPSGATLSSAEPPVDVIRFTECNDDGPDSPSNLNASHEWQTNQALGYLLRRLRDSQQGDVA